jgi:hypothetical protein
VTTGINTARFRALGGTRRLAAIDLPAEKRRLRTDELPRQVPSLAKRATAEDVGSPQSAGGSSR